MSRFETMVIDDQMELSFRTKAQAVDAEAVADMMAFLRSRSGWVLAKEFPGIFTESDKRRLRAIAAASKGEIIGGQRGYNLTRRVGATEYHESRSGLAKMRDDLNQRMADLDRVFHRNPRP
jgi:hypothetical protein